MKKSKTIFMVLAILAVLCMIGFSAGIAESSLIIMLLSAVLFIAIFGYGFTMKKKYRENNWL
ncbi:hypothetical protein ERX37_04300 [Macrococcus hajekii]|uniref:YlaF family protein n=1 Tax=Macrococcus hajekii TaxID=198482 RepID=A0A4R6BNM4_9STAP|nr:DUF5325 family protein [Macrococcus hajekii]TDM03312.1 hypothetical protein ERX37_04300 [Macrococcus hajekii]GGA97814.1 membrane protein [Macrococcus hajekii]